MKTKFIKQVLIKHGDEICWVFYFSNFYLQGITHLIYFFNVFRYIVVGENATYKYSDNASSWSQSKTSGNVHFNDIEYFGNSNWGGAADYAHTTRQNVVGDQFSSDPITEDQSSYFFKNYNGLTIGDDIILVGDQGFIAWSPDYMSFWTKDGGTSKNLRGTVHGNSIYVIVGDNGTILTSDNGSTWTSRADGRTDKIGRASCRERV